MFSFISPQKRGCLPFSKNIKGTFNLQKKLRSSFIYKKLKFSFIYKKLKSSSIYKKMQLNSRSSSSMLGISKFAKVLSLFKIGCKSTEKYTFRGGGGLWSKQKQGLLSLSFLELGPGPSLAILSNDWLPYYD
jgi:hypothetical protein